MQQVVQQVPNMFRVTSLTSMDERQLNKWIKRIALLLVAGTVLFTGFYILDRWRAPATPIVDRQLAALEEAVRDNPKDIASRGQLADTYVMKGRYEEAIAQYDLILDAGAQTELATFGRANAYLGLGDLDAAERDYQAVVDIAKDGEMAFADKTLAAAYYGLGFVAMKEDRATDAVGSLESALEINSADADALYLLGTAYAATGENEKAEKVLRRAVAFVPLGWGEPYAALAGVFGDAGKSALAEWAGAMADLSAGSADLAEPRLLSIADSDAALDAAIGLGLLYETTGKGASAVEWYGKALALDPDSASARMGLGRVGGGDTDPLPALPTPVAPGGEND